MTQQHLIKAFQALGCRVTPRAWDNVRDGEIVTTYGVLVSLSNTGSVAARTIRESDDVDPSAVVAELRKELAPRAKATRAAIRRERKAT